MKVSGVKEKKKPATQPPEGGTPNTRSMPCPKCAGTGRVDLTEALRAVLDFVRESGGCSAAQVHAALNPARSPYRFHPTAFNNRLEELRAAGLVERERFGKSWLYRIAD